MEISNLCVFLMRDALTSCDEINATFFTAMATMNEFPAICENCCGSDKHIKMIRQPDGEECKICTRPFTVFRWNANNQANKSMKTIICATCSRARNCCQSCMLDITYLIPLEIRDTALQMAGLPNIYSVSSSANREVKAIIADKQEAKFRAEGESEQAKDILLKLAEKLKGHTVAPKSAKALTKKAAAVKTGDVSKIVAKLPFGGLINVPTSDVSTTSFFIFGLSDDTPQYLITELFSKYGKLKNVTIVHRAKCGFVSFISRKSAEEFAKAVRNNGLNKSSTKAGLLLLENKYPVRVAWGKQKPLGSTGDEHQKIGQVATKVMKQLAKNQ